MSCPDCFRGGVAHGTPKGSITTLHGIETYIATPPTSSSSSTIIIYTDAFGLRLINNKFIADSYALLTGFRVLVPAVISGGGMDPSVMAVMDIVMEPVPWFDFAGQVRRAWNAAIALRHFVPFTIQAWPARFFPSSLDFARKVKADLPDGAKLGVVGFCWGGYQSLRLCAEADVVGGREGLVDAQFCAHPSMLKGAGDIVDAVKVFGTPVSIALGDRDWVLSVAKLEEAEAVLRDAGGRGDEDGGYSYEFKVYPGAGHGFAVRAKPGSDVEAKGADDAKVQAVEWFKRWL